MTPKLLWIDLEMTGLDIHRDRIIEFAALLTDYDLVPIHGSDFHRVISCDQGVLDGMDEWCTNTHGTV